MVLCIFVARTLCFVAPLPVVVVEPKDVAGRNLSGGIKAAGRSHGEGNDGLRVLRTRNVLLGRPHVIGPKRTGGARPKEDAVGVELGQAGARHGCVGVRPCLGEAVLTS